QNRVVTLPDLLPLDNLKIYDSKGVLIDQLADNGIHTSVTFDQVAPIMVNATVATEDKNFWTNEGIDVIGIVRALLANLNSGRVIEGGSTITQQLIKNLIVGNDPTIVRKLEEVILAPQVNNGYTKRDILTMYLNSIYYGNQAYGIDAAASVYFGLQDKASHSAASQLDIAQSAMLAGIPSNPTLFDPLAHPQTAMKRFETVLDLLVAQRYISTADKYDAIQEAQGKNFFKPAVTIHDRAPHFANFVLTQLQQIFHIKNPAALSRSGMVVYTTLDITLQDKIQKIMQQHIAELRDAHHLTNAAEVLIDFHTGAIRSLLGSIDYNNASIDGQFDVTQAY
ncbi:MAG TPA: transglycosylase domain-containing protein, partial [Ktedonobacteraceae bacterium]|nr:transglycosylase domain-containing protein [Ktedonobacteraceae bacterium]